MACEEFTELGIRVRTRSRTTTADQQRKSARRRRRVPVRRDRTGEQAREKLAAAVRGYVHHIVQIALTIGALERVIDPPKISWSIEMEVVTIRHRRESVRDGRIPDTDPDRTASFGISPGPGRVTLECGAISDGIGPGWQRAT